MTLGTRLLASMVQGKSVTEYLAFGSLAHLFDVDPVAKPLYLFVDGYVKEHSALPPSSWVQEKMGVELEYEEVAAGALHKELFQRYLSRAMKFSAEEANKVMKDDPKQAFEIMVSALQEIGANELSPMVSDFRAIMHDFWPSFAEQWSGGQQIIPWKWPTMQAQSKGMRGGDLISLVGRPGLGKQVPVDMPVLTPTGWCPIGEMKVGDAIIGQNGVATKILAIHPQGVKPSYKIGFRDGTSTECGLEHLWKVANSGGRNRNKWVVKTLQELLDYGLTSPRGGRLGANWKIPLVEPIQFPAQELRIDPYVLGVLLGDGAISGGSLAFSNPDIDCDIRGRVEAGIAIWGLHLEEDKGACPRLRICGADRTQFLNVLRALGVAVKSGEKSVPEAYLRGSVSQRLDILRGLMDTDGSCHKNRTTFHTTSESLANAVADLVRSLGGVSIVRPYDRADEGKPKEFQVNVKIGIAPFYTSRKLANWSPQHPSRYIWSAEFVRDVEQVCITVAAPDCLYITNDYIVTHNTWLLLSSALHTWQTTGKPVLFVSNEMLREVIMERLAAMYTGTPMDFFKDGISQHGTMFGATGKAGVKNALAKVEQEVSPFWVVDTQMAGSVDDVVALAQQFKVCAVYDDGAYMHSPPTKYHMSMQERVATNTNLLKQRVATRLKIPCVASWQFAREATKLKEGVTPGLEHIGYSDVIGQASTIAAALFQTDNTSNAELLNQRLVHILKGRGGETGSFPVSWDFQTMTFDEFVYTKDADSEVIY